MHLALFPNLKVVRCCTLAGLLQLLPVLYGRRLSLGLVSNFLGHFAVEGTGHPLEEVQHNALVERVVLSVEHRQLVVPF